MLVLFELQVNGEQGHGRTRYDENALETPIYRHTLGGSDQGRLLSVASQQLNHGEDAHHDEKLNLLARLALRALSLHDSFDLLTFLHAVAVAIINLPVSLVFHGFAPLSHKVCIAPPVLLGELFLFFVFLFHCVINGFLDRVFLRLLIRRSITERFGL